MFSTLLYIENSHDLIEARRAGREAARDLGAGGTGETLAATVVSELVRNLLQHAGGGEVRISTTEDGLAIETLDRGPGILDTQLAITRGYSTGNGSGLGLAAVDRVAASMEFVDRVPKGLVIRVILPTRRLRALPGERDEHQQRQATKLSRCERATRRQL